MKSKNYLINAFSISEYKKVKRKNRDIEAQECIKFIKWCRIHSLIGEIWENGKLIRPCLMIHHANERKTTVQHAVKLKAMGVSSGIPDFQLFLTSDSDNKFCPGLFIEMKSPGKKLNPNQKIWFEALKRKGYKTEISYTSDEAIEIVKGYLNDL